jgi:uncharacterized protein (DUF427 family)
VEVNGTVGKPGRELWKTTDAAKKFHGPRDTDPSDLCSRPKIGEQCHLLQHRLRGLLLFVRWVTVFPQNSFHQHAQRDRVAFAWRAMDAFYEEDERIVGHAADAYHRIDIRQTSRHLVVKDGVKPIADTKRPIVLYESGFAPRWYVPREDIDESVLVRAEGQTFCPYKGLASYYDIGDRKRAAWYYPQAWPEVARISNLVSFEPDEVQVFLDDKKLALEPGQNVTPHGIDRGLDPDEILKRGDGPAGP